MKQFRKFCSILLMTLVLAFPAFAGETSGPPEEPGIIHTPGRMSSVVKVSLSTTFALAIQNIRIVVR